jgi:hypothetical protein
MGRIAGITQLVKAGSLAHNKEGRRSAVRDGRGGVAQSVEQRTFNP